ncbi:metal-sensitive transcriptional regulator [Haloferula sp. BvORR071]|uniref:metal-sensitive transcriptional regulator n=1 Tax=Haloferula sp. BvORR071 TaxID=1396141 RepID=UPI0005581BD5|nr:metal-sensitive transcriptional regulator [Haloferula sp. BvORR071]
MSHSPEDPEADRRALQLRLRKIIGQLQAIEKTVGGDYECGEVLNQLVSARKAIKSLAEKIVLEHLEHCLEDMGPTGKSAKQLREVATMLKRYVE